ncbi:MAG: hypothetical protein RL140_282 [Actinomycetota bacterium]|jgi:hypothetical protein
MKFFSKVLVAVLLIITASGSAATAGEGFDVKIIKGSHINLVSKASRVPVLIQNNYDTEVRVLIHVSTSNLRVRLPETTSVVIPPNSTVNATVPVQAVANGNVDLYVWLSSFSGERLGDTKTISMTVIGDAELIALGSMGVLVVLLLIAGTIRMIRRRKQNA